MKLVSVDSFFFSPVQFYLNVCFEKDYRLDFVIPITIHNKEYLHIFYQCFFCFVRLSLFFAFVWVKLWSVAKKKQRTKKETSVNIITNEQKNEYQKRTRNLPHLSIDLWLILYGYCFVFFIEKNTCNFLLLKEISMWETILKISKFK